MEEFNTVKLWSLVTQVEILKQALSVEQKEFFNNTIDQIFDDPEQFGLPLQPHLGLEYISVQEKVVVDLKDSKIQ